MKVLMLVINPMVADARVDKEAGSLAAAGADVTVLATAGPDTLPTEHRDGFTIIRLPYQRVIKDRVTGTISRLRERGGPISKILSRGAWLFGGAFLKVGRSRLLPTEYYKGLASQALTLIDSPDVVHAHDLVTLRAAVRLSVEWEHLSGSRPGIVYDSHELYVEQQTRWRWWEKLAWRVHEHRWIRHADAVITVSSGIADEMRRRYRLAARPTVILNTPRSVPSRSLGRTVREDLNLDHDTPLVVYAGAVKASRGVDVLISALEHLPKWHLALVGATPSQLALTLGVRVPPDELRGRLHTIPPVPSWALPEYLSSADVGAHPLPDTCLNHSLALPNKLFDYAFAGLPIVANDLPEMAGLLQSREIGTVCDATSPSDLALAIRTTRGLQISPEAIENLDWEHQEEKLLALYDGITGSVGDLRN